MAVEDQDRDSPLLRYWPISFSGILLVAVGNVLVLSSMYRLGIAGTYLGDYFGITMRDRVACFPFNVMEHPMYGGSSMIFFGYALR